MTNSEATSDIEIYKQQFDRLSIWSQFYHDAEIRVNTNSIIITAVAAVAQKWGNISTGIPWTNLRVNLIGIIIIISSLAALISTLGYWRYYELCDMYARNFRDKYINSKEFASIREKTDKDFKRKYRLLAQSWFEDAHHLVWIVVQVSLVIVGAVVAFHS